MNKIKRVVVKLLEKIFRRKIIFLPWKRPKELVNRTAVLSRDGFWYVGNIADSSDIAHGVLVNGQVEKEGTELVKKIVDFLIKKSKGVVYDIGANTGYFGILAASRGDVKVFAFEPIKEFTETEKLSIMLNRFEDKVKVFNFALGEKDSTANFFVEGSGTSMKPDFLGGRGKESRLIEVKSLDNVINEQRLPDPGFIKIDVEGAELEVLKGAKKVLQEQKPIIWYESAKSMPERRFVNSDFEDTQKFLQLLGYRIFFCDGPELRPVEQADMPIAGAWMYLAVPKSFDIKQLFN